MMTIARKEWRPVWARRIGPDGFWLQWTCHHCQLEQREHINGVYCPEWRLRQLDGDR